MVADARDVKTLGYLALVPAEDSAQPADPSAPQTVLVGPLEDALVSVLDRDERALVAIRELVRTGSESLHPTVVRALGRGGRANALELLHDMARADESLLPLVISQVRSLGSCSDAGVNAQWGRTLQANLYCEDEGLCRASILALGELSCYEAIPALLHVLESGDEGACTNATWALRRMTALGFGDNPERWKHWYEAERTWYDRDFPRLLHDLHTRDRARIVAAVRAISSHRYRRHDLAEGLAFALEGTDPVHLPLFCTALSGLGSDRALPTLVRMLERERRPSAYAEHLRAALCSISGRDLPADPELWRRELGLND